MVYNIIIYTVIPWTLITRGGGGGAAVLAVTLAQSSRLTHSLSHSLAPLCCQHFLVRPRSIILLRHYRARARQVGEPKKKNKNPLVVRSETSQL